MFTMNEKVRTSMTISGKFLPYDTLDVKVFLNTA